ncbi:MAG: single-stranded DNA-binding protein [Oscillospiraceae bacterium]|jgi:single-strand DNA-binding protein|nr:single-stranded DNA-binding protein [Oscillospiraceae bacterium]
MLNTAIIMGRLTFEPELKSTGSGINVCSFTVAVDRGGKVQPGAERQTDFIRCVAWRERAEFLTRYFHKGSMIAVQGSLQVRNFEDKNGVKRETAEIVVDNISFTGEKKGEGGFGGNNEIPLPPPPPGIAGGQGAAPAYSTGSAADFDEIAGEDDLPF